MYSPSIYFDWAGFLILETLTFLIEFGVFTVINKTTEPRFSLGDVALIALAMNLASGFFAVFVWIGAGVSIVDLSPIYDIGAVWAFLITILIVVAVIVSWYARRQGKQPQEQATP